jgi:hypothetical protein
MKTKTIAMFVLLLTFGMDAKSEENEFPVFEGSTKMFSWCTEGFVGNRVVDNVADKSLRTELNFGNIKTGWSGHTRDACRIKLTTVLSSPFLQFAILQDTENLDQVKDPSKYKYFSEQEQKMEVIDRVVDKNRGDVATREEPIVAQTNAIVPMRSIIILRYKNEYLAIKPISYGKVGDTVLFPPKTLFVDWKYWPNIGSSNVAEQSIVTNKKKPNTKAPAQGKKEKAESLGWQVNEVSIGKEFFIGETKFKWEDVSEKFANETKKHYTYRAPTFFLDLTFRSGGVTDASVYDDNERTSIIDPSQYSFLDLRDVRRPGTPKRDTVYGYGTTWRKGQNSTLILKIEGEYVAIQPMEEKDGWVQYKWKYWPKESPKTLASISQNQ